MHKFDNQLEDFFGVGGTGDHSHTESIRDTITRKLSLKSRLRLLPKVLSMRERYVVLGLVVATVVGIIAIPISAYYHFTVAVPADGGSIIEGIVGQPRLINPLLAPTNDADRDLATLIYSGLYRYNAQGKLVPDLAKSMPEVTSDGLSYSVTIRDNAMWQDGVPLTADDVVFTVRTAQNSDYGAPITVRAAWSGVEVERAADRVVIFHLKSKYAQFPNNNLTMGILPQHLWQDVKAINFPLSELNTKPIGSGPYQFKSFIKDGRGTVVSYKLAAFPQYVTGRPYIDEIIIQFYDTEEKLIAAFNSNDIDSIAGISGSNVDKLKFTSRIELQRLKMPRLYALFFNQNQSAALADKNVRLALNHATDRVAIINATADGNAFLVNSPMLGGILDINPNVKTYDFDPVQAAKVLDAGGWKLPGEGSPGGTSGGIASGDDGIRVRNRTRMELKITTSTFPELTQAAQLIADQWKALGVNVTIESLPISQLQQVIRDRSYQILLFGEILTPDPDPFPLWHSSQREGSGQNFALYSNPAADALLEEARATLNPLERAQKYNDFQNILIQDIPAVFLYSSDYIYGLSDRVHGFDSTILPMPSDRFSSVAQWYINTTREFK